MDVNSAYTSSLDEEIFAVHLMFEEPLPDESQPTTSPQKDVFGRSNFVLPAYTSPSGKVGVAFERGLDEVCLFCTHNSTRIELKNRIEYYFGNNWIL